MTASEAKPTLILVAREIVQQSVTSVDVRNSEMLAYDTEEKLERFDVNCKIDNNMQANIEMQAQPMEEEEGSNHENLRSRSIHYLSKLHSSQRAKGKRYNSLSRTYQVMFCGFTVFPRRKSYINSFSMRHDSDNGLLHNGIQSIFVELTKLRGIMKKPIEQMTDMEKFAIFLKYANDRKHREIVNEVIKSREGLIVASEVLQSISKNEREQAIFLSRKKAQMDLVSNFATAEKRGIDKGRKEGIKEGKIEERFAIARNLLSMNFPIEQIVIATGLSREEVEQSRVIN